MTRRRPDPLLCELHAHSSWSDGALTIRELADLYGRRGFDVLCITDHHLRLPPGAVEAPRVVTSTSHEAYLETVEREARRARELYDLLIVPGLELTYEDTIPAVPRTRSRSGCAPGRRSRMASTRRSRKLVRPVPR
jgi:histidinol phosphatase-like PHP family hydrolase